MLLPAPGENGPTKMYLNRLKLWNNTEDRSVMQIYGDSETLVPGVTV